MTKDTTNKKLLPVGIQSFEEIIKGNYLYVDKTDLIYKMVSEGKYYFLSRPRRFGKSLLISTLDCYFSGKKDLFKGLMIEKLEHTQKEYPVFRFDLSKGNINSSEVFENKLSNVLEEKEKIYGRNKSDKDLSSRFERLLKNAYKKTGLQSVILVDEYDKPMLDNIDNEKLDLELRNTFKGFFGIIKGCDDYIKFAFFTGITKLRNVSIFSELNNLGDISLSDDFASLCGITKEELLYNFKDYIKEMSEENNISENECVEKLKTMYDGYHFTKALVDVYNPFSLLNAFKNKDISSYWFGQALPSFLIKRLEEADWELANYTFGKEIDAPLLDDIDIDEKDPTALLYQSGYLTIKEYIKEDNAFLLKYPNKEIQEGFTKCIVPKYLGGKVNNMLDTIKGIRNDLKEGEVCSLFNELDYLYTTLPYIEGNLDINKAIERDFKNVLSITFTLLGAYIQVEQHYSRGRVDIIIQNKDYVYILEAKVDQSPEDALKQIKDKGYADPFKNDKRKVIKIGVNFSSEKRNIDGYLAE